MQASDKVFVYGTLRRAGRADVHEKFLAGRVEWIGDGTVAGRLYLVSWFPALVAAESEDERVTGEVYRLIDFEQTMAELDEFEDCNLARPESSEYTRRVVEVRMADGAVVSAWCYFYLRSVDGLKRLTTGDFVAE